MKKKINNNLTSFADHPDEQSFRLGVMLQELRKEQGLTQEQLAAKCGTTKTYISRIENDASDIRLSTLMRIIREGLDGHLRFNVDKSLPK